jgi:hypothetical protein
MNTIYLFGKEMSEADHHELVGKYFCGLWRITGLIEQADWGKVAPEFPRWFPYKDSIGKP